jgi:hypothetical protein
MTGESMNTAYPAASDSWTYREPHVLGVDLSRVRDLVGVNIEATDGRLETVDAATYARSESYVVVDATFGTRALLPAALIHRVDLTSATVYIDRSKDEVSNAPRYEEGRDVDAYRSELSGYYYGLRAEAIEVGAF